MALEDEGDEEGERNGEAAEAGEKKKKKRSRKKKGPREQTEPPSIPVKQLFPGGVYPEGEWQSYREDQRWRETDAEKRDREKLEVRGPREGRERAARGSRACNVPRVASGGAPAPRRRARSGGPSRRSST